MIRLGKRNDRQAPHWRNHRSVESTATGLEQDVSIALAWVLRGGWRYIAGALAIAALWFAVMHWVHGRENAATMAERGRWQVAQAKSIATAVTLAQERQNAVDAAQIANAERDRLYALKTAPIIKEVTRYVKSTAGVVRCVDADGLRIGADSIAAANAATQATR